MNSEDFSKLLEEDLSSASTTTDEVVVGTVIDISSDYVTVDVNRKSEALIARDEFCDAQGELEVKVGDQVKVAFERQEDEYGFGEIPLSRLKAKRAETWKMLDEAHQNGEVITGFILESVRGGFTVAIDSIRAFLPGSLIDVRPIRDTSYLIGKEWKFKIVKIDKRRNNIVVSRKAVIEGESQADREALLASLEEGQEMIGVVKNLTDYGAFVDLGGIDGLLHITDMSWNRIKHPSDIINVGDEIKVAILKFDREKSRVSLGMKQLGEDPLVNIMHRYPVGSRITGKVTNVTDYGCFVEIGEGIEGLVHMSEMDWTSKSVHPSKVVQPGDEVEVLVLSFDEKRRRISLGIKQCVENPWEQFAEKYQSGDCFTGTIKSITDFGIFVGLEGNIDGLVHLSDISSKEPGDRAIRKHKKGEQVKVCVLSIDAERERISLSMKEGGGDDSDSTQEAGTDIASDDTIDDVDEPDTKDTE